MSRNNKKTTTIQKYCKVCHDAGKTETEYTSHFIRTTPDPKSPVVCPTLLALECRFCCQNGHTVKYCPVAKANEKQHNRVEALSRHNETTEANKIKWASATTQQKRSNLFAYLSYSDSEEEINEEPEQFPVLSASTSASVATASVASASNYKNALEKRVTIEIPEPKPEIKPAPWVTSVTSAAMMSSWTDCETDSEDDD